MKSPPSEKPKKSLGDFWLKHFQNICLNSSMHGAYYLAKPRLCFLERVLWFCILFASGNMIFYLWSILIRRHVDTPIRISIERDHINWETFFPPITLCARDKVNETALQQFIREHKPRNENKTRNFLRALVNLSFDNLHLGLPECTDIDAKDYLSIIHRLSNRHENYAAIETASKRPLKFRLEEVLTEFGPCLSFNSGLLRVLSWNYLLDEQMGDNSWNSPPVTKHPPVTAFKFFYAQGEVAATIKDINETSPHDIFFHGPLGLPTLSQRVVMPNDSSIVYTHLHFSVRDIVTHVKVKKLYAAQRKCLFFYEGHLQHSPHFYSYELCLRECRIEKMKRLCGCFPPFYPLVAADDNYCTPKNLSCISDHFDEITTNCGHCYSSCDDTTFQLTSAKQLSWLRNNNSLRWEVVPSKTRFRRDVQFSMVDLLVSFGTCTGFFMGLSVLSITEFFFFYCIHVCHAYKKYYKE